jgi:hypothetical protein
MNPSETKGILPTYMGGLGNQMFIVAAAYVASKTHGCPLYIPKNTASNNKHNRFQHDYTDSIFKHFGIQLPDSFDIVIEAAKQQGYIVRNPSGFQHWSIQDHGPGTIMQSYYQYYPSLQPFEQEVRTLFLQGIADQRTKLAELYDVSNAAFLHIRRGDYVKLAHIYYPITSEHYELAVKRLLESEHPPSCIYVVSDDYNWILQQPFLKQSTLFIPLKLEDELDCLALMSLCCKGAIIANSTFSIWGAFLGSYGAGAPVYVPERWFSESFVSLFPSDWIVLREEEVHPPILDPDTAFVTACDKSYFPKAKKTIEELRSNGRWKGQIVLITIGFNPEWEFIKSNDIVEFSVEHIDTDGLVKQLKANPIKAMADNRHFGKLYQWDKFYVFSEFFKGWSRIVFLDAGIRVLGSVQPLLDLDWKGKFLAPDDSDPYDNGNRFRCQLDLDANPAVNDALFSAYPQEILDKKYFLNCMFLYDTALLERVSFRDFVDAMNAYPICLCNEMVIMNLFFTFKLDVWEAFPLQTSSGKYLFSWAETNYKESPHWSQFHFMKYPKTI